jgi:hypothetical protein
MTASIFGSPIASKSQPRLSMFQENDFKSLARTEFVAIDTRHWLMQSESLRMVRLEFAFAHFGTPTLRSLPRPRRPTQAARRRWPIRASHATRLVRDWIFDGRRKGAQLAWRSGRYAHRGWEQGFCGGGHGRRGWEQRSRDGGHARRGSRGRGHGRRSWAQRFRDGGQARRGWDQGCCGGWRGYACRPIAGLSVHDGFNKRSGIWR